MQVGRLMSHECYDESDLEDARIAERDALTEQFAKWLDSDHRWFVHIVQGNFSCSCAIDGEEKILCPDWESLVEKDFMEEHDGLTPSAYWRKLEEEREARRLFELQERAKLDAQNNERLRAVAEQIANATSWADLNL